VGARSPFSRSVSAERRLFRVLRFVGSGSGRRQGICATEVSTGYDVKQDPSVTGDWLNLPNVTLWAMPEGDKREEEPFLQHFDWYEATAYRQLAPGQSSSIDVPITEPLILVATTDWYGNGGIINQEISLNGTHLAGGIPMIIDDNRGTVTSQITISQNGTARVTRTNTGTKPITIRPAVGTIRPAELESP